MKRDSRDIVLYAFAAFGGSLLSGNANRDRIRRCIVLLETWHLFFVGEQTLLDEDS